MFDRLNIRVRLAVMYVMLGALLLAIAGLGLWAANTQYTAFEKVNFHLIQGQGHALSVRVEMLQLRRHEKDLVIGVGDAAKRADALAKWEETNKRLATHLAELDKRVTDPGNKGLLEEVKRGIGAYQAGVREVVPKLDGMDVPTANDTIRKASREAYTKADKAAETAIATVDGFVAKAAERLRGLYDLVLKATLAAVLIGAVAVVWLGRKVSQSIIVPLRRAEDFAATVKDGDLTADLPVVGSDECARLSASLRDMQVSLQGIVGNVRTAADNIQVASSEVASGNHDLSHRTEQTAASLQQTASAMNQITATVNQTADAARTAAQLASQASGSAERGGAVVGEVVSTMERINQGSRRIADIIGTIDGIAFQTNILALNAAVEAARAGEAGRGFAVVAGEVRLLAGRSAEAAKEIKSLINASVESVDVGSRLVADAGSTMSEIVANVQRVTDIIGEISAATGEQSSGIGNVNESVAQLDQATQQNAALVEESAAAAQSLREQAQKLAEVVSSFRLPGMKGGAPKPMAAPAPKPVAKPAAKSPVAAKAPAPAPTAKVSAPPPAPRPAPAAAPADDGDWETF